MTSVEVRGVSRVYGRQRALHPTSFTLRAGEGVALLGPNGAGKSTLVSILSTLVTPSTGEVLYAGRPADAAVRREIGVVAHESLVYGDLSAVENLRFFARLYGVSANLIAATLTRVGLDAAPAARPARTYSRGMLQRLSLARALIHAPRLLLLDEPFTGLDPSGTALIRALLAEERARGATVLVVTHDFDALAGLADRALVLDRGRLTVDEPLSDLAAAYHKGVR